MLDDDGGEVNKKKMCLCFLSDVGRSIVSFCCGTFYTVDAIIVYVQLCCWRYDEVLLLLEFIALFDSSSRPIGTYKVLNGSYAYVEEGSSHRPT